MRTGLLIAVHIACAISAQARAADWATLTCKSGADIALKARMDFDKSIVKDFELVTGLRPVVIIDFKRPSGAAGGSGAGLQPGQCSWSDRPLSDGEPSCMSAQLNQGQIETFILKEYQFSANGRASSDGAAMWPDNKLDSLKRVVTTSGRVFTIRVKNSGGACMLMSVGDNSFPAIAFK
jgi:hypothetical protein